MLIDVFRILTIQMGLAMIVTTVLIVVRFSQANRITPRAGGFLPLHVATIALAFIIFAASGVAETIGRLGHHRIVWQSFALFTGFMISNIAQAAMYAVVKARMQTVQESEAKKKAS